MSGRWDVLTRFLYDLLTDYFENPKLLFFLLDEFVRESLTEDEAALLKVFVEDINCSTLPDFLLICEYFTIRERKLALRERRLLL